ncbi:MAG TPA: hypothetical protein VIL74_20415 [Pyrinomonadaceae bacterium]|jgi:hypothetical protein
MAVKGNAGFILGVAGSDSGQEVRLARLNFVRRWDKDGNETDPKTETKSGGAYVLEFQWDPVDIAKLIDPAARFAVLGFHPDNNYDVAEGVPLIVMNARAVFKGESPAVRDAPSGYEKETEKLMNWVKNNSEVAHKIAVHSNVWRSTELVACMGIAVL